CLRLLTGVALVSGRQPLLWHRDACVWRRDVAAGPQALMIARSTQHQFGSSQNMRVFRAPGRVNLIGEHTDYNLGFVLPIALDLECVTVARPSAEGRLHVYTENFKKSADWDPAEIPRLKPDCNWTDYVVGVAQQLIAA